MKTVQIGVIGFGQWGPNHVRVLEHLVDSRVRVIADKDKERLKAAQQQFPSIEITPRVETLFEDAGLDAVVISTPVATHYDLVKTALLSGKDVLVEKPISFKAREAEDLRLLAERQGRVLMCGHIFLFNAGVRKLRDLIEDGALGRVYYMAATRTNLGPIRRDVNAVYDLGSHDVSIFHYLLGARPSQVVAWGQSFLNEDQEDVTFGCLEYPNGTLCHMHVSWLNPRKERTIVVVGDRKMAVWDDVNTLEPIRVYDKGVLHKPSYDSFGEFQMVLRDADVLIPKLVSEEPLKLQNQHFLECIRGRLRPLCDGAFARDVVFTLEALQCSLRQGGGRQTVSRALENSPLEKTIA